MPSFCFVIHKFLKKTIKVNLCKIFGLSLLCLVSVISLSRCGDSIHYGRVVRVIDGDTIVLDNGRHVRYLGIDTPELERNYHGVWIKVNQPYAKSAKEFNSSVVLGRRVRLEFDKIRTDRYGRLLAYCYVGSEMINAELLKNGLAFIFFMEPNSKYADKFKKLLCEAIRAHKGIWSRKDAIINAKDMPLYNHQVKMVKGKVCRVVNAGSRSYLYLSCVKGQYRRIVLSYVYFQDFSATDYNTFSGREVCCIGKIVCNRRLCQIKIFHPIQLSLCPYCKKN